MGGPGRAGLAEDAAEARRELQAWGSMRASACRRSRLSPDADAGVAAYVAGNLEALLNGVPVTRRIETVNALDAYLGASGHGAMNLRRPCICRNLFDLLPVTSGPAAATNPCSFFPTHITRSAALVGAAECGSTPFPREPPRGGVADIPALVIGKTGSGKSVLYWARRGPVRRYAGARCSSSTSRCSS